MASPVRGIGRVDAERPRGGHWRAAVAASASQLSWAPVTRGKRANAGASSAPDADHVQVAEVAEHVHRVAEEVARIEEPGDVPEQVVVAREQPARSARATSPRRCSRRRRSAAPPRPAARPPSSTSSSIPSTSILSRRQRGRGRARRASSAGTRSPAAALSRLPRARRRRGCPARRKRPAEPRSIPARATPPHETRAR